jgi:hypothetical protein
VGFDPELTASSVSALVAISDTELTADARNGTMVVLEAWAAWRLGANGRHWNTLTHR